MPLSLASVKSILVLPFWFWLTCLVLEKGPLNGCVCVCSEAKNKKLVSSSNSSWTYEILLLLLLDYRNVEVRCQSDVGVMSVSGRADRQLPYCPGGHMCEYLLIVTAWHYAIVVFSVVLYVHPSITGKYCIKTTGWIELIFGMEDSYYHIPHCVVRKFGYLQNLGYFPLLLCPKLWTWKILPWQVDVVVNNIVDSEACWQHLYDIYLGSDGRDVAVYFVHLATTLLKEDKSARDNHLLACNFAKYSPILKTFWLGDSAINLS